QLLGGDDPCDSDGQDSRMGEQCPNQASMFTNGNIKYVASSEKGALSGLDARDIMLLDKGPARPTTLPRHPRLNVMNTGDPDGPTEEQQNSTSSSEQSPGSETPSTSSEQVPDSKNPPVQYIPSSEIDHHQLQFIGSGAFGTVYRTLWRDQVVALKILNLPSGKIDREASHLCRLAHPNVVRFFGVCELGPHDSPALVMEFAHGGPLNRVLATHPILGPSTLLNWAIQVATGMAYLHSDAHLVHRDLKSSNILIREPLAKPYGESDLRNCTLIITDFGMACRSSELVSQQSKLGTVAYAAPEVCRQSNFSFHSDVWSYGVVLWELLTLETPFRHFEQPRLLFIIGMYNYTLHIPDDVPELFGDLLSDCWSATPTDRPKFEEIIARLQCSTYCEFLSMDAEELARVQSGWRNAIAAYHQEEQEAAAATLSSSITDVSQRTSMVDDDLTVEKELLQHGWESLDQQWQELVARQQEIDMKEENYTRMLGTLGHQFTLLAVLAANQLKEWPPPATSSLKPLPPPTARKRPFVRTFFRWGANSSEVPARSGGQMVNAPITKEPKASVGSQRSLANSDTAESTQVTPSTARSSDSLAPSSSDLVQQNRLGCSLGGIPHISPPVNMKHMVHVDHDWIRGHHHGIGDSSICLFPCVLQSNNYETITSDRLKQLCDLPVGSKKHLCPTDPHQTTPTDQTHTLTQPFRPPNRDSSSIDAPSIDRHMIHQWSSGSERAGTYSLKKPTSRSQPSVDHHFGVRKPLPKAYRAAPKALRKASPTVITGTTVGADPGDIFSRTSSRSCGYSNFFTPVSGSEVDSPVGATRDSVDLWNAKTQPRVIDNRSSLHTRRAATIGRSVALQVDHDLQPASASNGLDLSDRRRSASGPILSSNLVNQSATCFPGEPQSCRCLHRDVITATDELVRLLSSLDPPTLSTITNRTPPSSEQGCSLTVDNSKRCIRNSVETALWSAFRLAVSVSYLPHLEADLAGTQDSGRTASACIATSNSDSVGHTDFKTFTTGPITASEEHTSSQMRQRFHRTPQRQPIRPGGLFHPRFGNKNAASKLSAASSRPPIGTSAFDSRLRIQSVDRLGQPNVYLCVRCRQPAVLAELSGDSRIDHQAEFGDPHSPFLGMLAGSGRRPTASSSSSNTCQESSAAVMHTFSNSPTPSPTGALFAYPPCWACVRQPLPPRGIAQRQMDQTLTPSCCLHTPSNLCYLCAVRGAQLHTPSHSSSEVPSNLSSPSTDEHICCDHPPMDYSNHARSLSTYSHTATAVTTRPFTPVSSPTTADSCRHHPQQQQLYSHPGRHHSTTSCWANADPDRLRPPITAQRIGAQRSFDLGVSNTRHTTVPSAGQRQPPLDHVKADSHPSLSFTSYNPVAHSRDAYFKATQDGYLNPTVPAMSPLSSGHLEEFPSPWADTTRVRSRLHSLDHRLRWRPTDEDEVEKHPSGQASGDSDDSDGSFSGFRQDGHKGRLRQQDEDGLTLVPTDGLDGVACVLNEKDHSLHVNGDPVGASSSRVHERSVPKTAVSRRLLYRSPAIRSARKPTFLSLGHYRSRPDCSQLPWPQNTSSSPANSPERQKESPCGPFVSDHATLL
ncbi:mitogen-activated protein kinase kinase kinase 9, partial [Clonorchis sinensis]